MDTRSLPLSEWFAKPGRSGEQLFKGKFPNSTMLAVRIDFVGSSTAEANAGVEDRLFTRHGHWKSESAKDDYVKDSLDRRLKVSKGLGI